MTVQEAEVLKAVKAIIAPKPSNPLAETEEVSVKLGRNSDSELASLVAQGLLRQLTFDAYQLT
jgi:hypothetical protein